MKISLGPVLALFGSIVLLVLVLITRPADAPAPTGASGVSAALATQPPATSMKLPATATPLPTLPPATSIPLAQVDTATLHEAVVGCFRKLNPLLAGYNQPDLDVNSLIFEGLATTNEYGAAVPDLAETWTASHDGLTYSIKLRGDAYWQDGVKFTSADVLFTIHLMQDPDFPGRTDLRNFWQTVEVEAIDELTVRIRLAQPLAAFPDYLRIGMLPEHALKGTPAARLSLHPFNLSPIGTGPYQFDGLIGTNNQVTGVRLRLAASYQQRPDFKGGYALRQIVFRCFPSFNDAMAAFQRGEVNAVSELPADTVKQVAGLTNMTVYTAYRPAFGAVIYNWRRDEVKFLRDLRMRQALSRSVDRTALVNKYLAGRAVAADGAILPSSWAYAPDVSCPAFDPKDPDAAKTALSLVQSQPSATNVPIAPDGYRIQLLVNNDPALANMANDIVKSWNTLGLQTSVVVVDGVTFKERLTAGNFDAALVELDLAPSADPDPYSLWRQVPADGGLNFGGLNDRRLSELVETSRRATNGVYRAELYKDFQRLFCERAAALLMYYPVYVYGVDARLAGVQLGFLSDPSERFRTLREWRFAETKP